MSFICPMKFWKHCTGESRLWKHWWLCAWYFRALVRTKELSSYVFSFLVKLQNQVRLQWPLTQLHPSCIVLGTLDNSSHWGWCFSGTAAWKLSKFGLESDFFQFKMQNAWKAWNVVNACECLNPFFNGKLHSLVWLVREVALFKTRLHQRRLDPEASRVQVSETVSESCGSHEATKRRSDWIGSLWSMKCHLQETVAGQRGVVACGVAKNRGPHWGLH